jgi:alkylhydroperoxidase domain protein
MSVTRRKPQFFTLDELDWEPWIETIAEMGKSDEEPGHLYEQAPNAKGSPYFATLALDLPALVQRTGLFNNAMRSAGGATNAERELAATAVSRVNGCVYCASVHARRYAVYSKKQDVIERLLDEGVGAPLDDPKEQAIVDFSVRLTESPATLSADDVRPLRAAGFSDLEIYDIAVSTAMFAWANRLMQTLGEGVYPEDD